MEVTMRATQSSMGSALVGVCFLAFSPAVAEPLSDSEKIERLERQTELMREQMNRQNDLIMTLQQEVARTKKKSEKRETELAKRSEPLVDSKRSEPSVNTRESEASVNSRRDEPPPYIPTTAEIIRGTQPAV